MSALGSLQVLDGAHIDDVRVTFAVIQALCPTVFSSKVSEDVPERVVGCIGHAPNHETQRFTHTPLPSGFGRTVIEDLSDEKTD
jgi:hypothetical protein